MKLDKNLNSVRYKIDFQVGALYSTYQGPITSTYIAPKTDAKTTHLTHQNHKGYIIIRSTRNRRWDGAGRPEAEDGSTVVRPRGAPRYVLVLPVCAFYL